MKNGKWIILVVIFVLAGAGIWWWQSSTSSSSSSSQSIDEQIRDGVTPEVELVGFNISNIDGDRIDAVGEVKITNPFPIEISTQRINYNVFVDSIKVIEDAYDEPVEIESSGNTVLEVPVEILADPMERVFGYFSRHQIDSANYTLNLNFQVDVPVAGEKEFNMELSSRMPSFQLTDVELENVDLNLLSSDDGIDIVVHVTNPNVYDIKMRNPSFYLVIEDDLELRGHLDNLIVIPARGTDAVTIHIEKERGSFTQTGLSFLTDQEGTGFTYYFSYTMVTDNDFLDGATIETTVDGTLDEISNAM